MEAYLAEKNVLFISIPNLEFEQWEETFKAPVLTAAIVDRIAHRAHILDLSGSSFRVEDTK